MAGRLDHLEHDSNEDDPLPIDPKGKKTGKKKEIKVGKNLDTQTEEELLYRPPTLYEELDNPLYWENQEPD